MVDMTVTFVSSFQGRKTDLSSETEKDIANFTKSINLWSKNVGISRFSQGLCGNEINKDTFH